MGLRKKRCDAASSCSLMSMRIWQTCRTRSTGQNRCGKPRSHAQLVEHMLQMLLDCQRTDAQVFGNLHVGLAANDPKKNVGFTARQTEFPECGNANGFLHAKAPLPESALARQSRMGQALKTSPAAARSQRGCFGLARSFFDADGLIGNTLFGVLPCEDRFNSKCCAGKSAPAGCSPTPRQPLRCASPLQASPGYVPRAS